MAKKVLIVDDDPAICDSLTKVLEQQGHQVATLSSPDEVLKGWGGMLPDVVVLDSACCKGGMTGRQLAEWMHTHVLIPVIFFSGSVTPELSKVADSIGAKVIPKPDIDALCDTIAQPV